jgi:RNA polymerase sporulation-specific sigma factor
MLERCFYESGELNEDEFVLLVKKFKGKIIGYIGKFFLPGADKEDLYQWGTIGLYNAVLKFDESKGNSFCLFADFYIRNTIKTAITSANRKKHEVLNSAVSLHCPMFNIDVGERILDYVYDKKAQDPLTIIIEKEKAEYLTYICRSTLSKMEKRVMKLYLEGYTQGQIAFELSMETRVVDNAIQRGRKKLIPYLLEFKKNDSSQLIRTNSYAEDLICS